MTSDCLEPDSGRPENVGQGGGGTVPVIRSQAGISMGFRLVAATRLGAGDFVAGAFSPARKVDPGPAGATGASAVPVLLVAGTLTVHGDLGGGRLAAARPDRFGVLEAILAESCELDQEVNGVGRPGCCPAALLLFLHEHRFVI